jgi:hypothetical protein
MHRGRSANRAGIRANGFIIDGRREGKWKQGSEEGEGGREGKGKEREEGRPHSNPPKMRHCWVHPPPFNLHCYLSLEILKKKWKNSVLMYLV